MKVLGSLRGFVFFVVRHVCGSGGGMTRVQAVQVWDALIEYDVRRCLLFWEIPLELMSFNGNRDIG